MSEKLRRFVPGSNGTARRPRARHGLIAAEIPRWIGLSLSALFYSSVFAIAIILLLGGGSANFYLTNAVVQILTLPSLIFATWRLCSDKVQPSAKSALLLIAAAVFLIFLHLIPLPPTIWGSLALHKGALAARGAIGGAAQWAPISLTPEATIVGALTLLPPLAIFLSVLSLSGLERRLLTVVPLAMGLVSAFVGLLQLSQGPESLLYFYAFAGRDDGNGIFANRNHQAALLYSLVPFAAAWIAIVAPTLSKRRHSQKYDTTALITLLAAGVTLFILIVATLIARSRVGVILLMMALAGSLALQSWRNVSGSITRARGVFALTAILAVLFGLQYGLYRILLRFEADPFADARITFARNTAKAALAALPLGTGIGSFEPVYASIERPDDLLADVYINHAHNDYFEFALEAGLPGMFLIICFLLWFILRIRQIWRGSKPDSDTLIARAATLSIGMLLAHEIVDYPMRTDAILAIFAFSCALLIPPSRTGADTENVRGTDDTELRSPPSIVVGNKI